MKHIPNKSLNKKSWVSRVTAPVLKLDLVVQCRNLPKKDLLSQADGFCVLWKIPVGYTNWGANGIPNKNPGRLEEEIGRTEVSRSCINPTFKHKFRLNFVFHEEQTFVLRVFDEDLRYATGLSEHDYLGGCVFSLGQLMGAKGCSLAKRLGTDGKKRSGAYLVVTGNGVVEDREVLEYRFACQDLVQQHNIIIDKIDRSKVIDKCRPYFRLERLNKDDQSWEFVWKSEVLKQTLDPVWNEARLPLQVLCNDDQNNPLKITVWDYEKNSSSHVILGFVESTVAEIIEKSKDGGIPVFIIMREKQKYFRGSKLKQVGLLKVLNASVMTVPSMLQYFSGGMSLDLMVGIDCSVANGVSESNLHFSKNNLLNDYQAGIKKLGTITENFSRGRHSSLWGLGAEIDGEFRDCYAIKEKLCESKSLLKAYEDSVVNDPVFALGKEVSLNQFIEAATFRTIRFSKKRPCYTVLAVFMAGDFVDLQETIDKICTAAEDAPISIIIFGLGNSEFSSAKKLCGSGEKNGKLTDSRGIPIAREIVTFVSFKQFGGNADEAIAEALKEIPEQFVQYQLMNGVKPLPVVPPPDFGQMASTSSRAPNKKHTKEISRRNSRESSGKTSSRSKSSRSNRRREVMAKSDVRHKHRARGKSMD